MTRTDHAGIVVRDSDLNLRLSIKLLGPSFLRLGRRSDLKQVSSLRPLCTALVVMAIFIVAYTRAEVPIFDLGNLKSIPLLVSSKHSSLEGVLRVINHSRIDGFVTILTCDDTGDIRGPITLTVRAKETLHIHTRDLEEGNVSKGIQYGLGKGVGDWHLYLRSLLDIEVMTFARSPSGFLTSTHDTVIADSAGIYRLSLLDANVSSPHSHAIRLINSEREEVDVLIEAANLHRTESIPAVHIKLKPLEAREINTAHLLRKMLFTENTFDDQSEPIRLTVSASFQSNTSTERPEIYVMYLNKSPERYIANLSEPPIRSKNRTVHVPYFPSQFNAAQRNGLLRLSNITSHDARITLVVWSEDGEILGELNKDVAAGKIVELTTRDITIGIQSNDHASPLASREGSWRLELISDSEFGTSVFVLSDDGGFWPIHDIVVRAGNRYRVPTVISPSDRNHEGIVRITNVNQDEANVEIRAIDRGQDAHQSIASLSLLPGHTRALSTRSLKGSPTPQKTTQIATDTISEWLITSNAPVLVQSTLVTSEGHVSNLSSAPNTYGYNDDFPGSDLMHVYNDNVLVMHVDHDVTEPLESPPVRYAIELYKNFEDVFDFLILLPDVDNWYSTTESTFGRYFAVMNDVEGIGRNRFVDARYGSAGKLRGVITLNFNRALIHGPALHELQHAWANFVIPTSFPSHWGFSSANGQLGGFKRDHLTHVGDNVFFAGESWNPRANGGNSVPYSPIELYLAGFLDAEYVPNLWVAPEGSWISQEQTQTQRTRSRFNANFTEIYTVEDIVQKHGVRVPDVKNSPKSFRAAVLLLVDERKPLFIDDIAIVSEHVRIFGLPDRVIYTSCRFRDPGDRYPYTRPCSGDLARPWYAPGLVSIGHRFYNYFEATDERATLTFDRLSNSVRATGY